MLSLLEFIQGQIIDKGINHVILQVGGLGYRLQISTLTCKELPSLKDEVLLYTYLHVREDELSLYGFSSIEEKDFFLSLLSVSGIGPRIALAVLSRFSPSQLHQTILYADSKTLESIPGVGKKMAERIILELKDKVSKICIEKEDIPIDNPVIIDLKAQAVAALQALGYTSFEAQKAVNTKMNVDQAKSVEDIIREALKVLAKY